MKMEKVSGNLVLACSLCSRKVTAKMKMKDPRGVATAAMILCWSGGILPAVLNGGFPVVILGPFACPVGSYKAVRN